MRREHKLKASRSVLAGVAALALVTVAGAQALSSAGNGGSPSGNDAIMAFPATVQGDTAALTDPQAVDRLVAEGWASTGTGKGGKPHVISETPEERVADVSSDTSFDVPQAALDAYRHAARSLAVSDPSCHLSWAVIAAIGQVESDHGRYGGTKVLADGSTYPHIVGLPLNGVGPVAAIPDSDGGLLDGDTVWDRAVGPMQFIPTTWEVLGLDGDGDGVVDPHDFDDAALATATYLCSGDVDFDVLAEARLAVYGYNHSSDYVTLVLSIAASYDDGVVDVVSNDDAPADTTDPDPVPTNPGPTNPGPTNPGPSNPGPTNPGPSNPGPNNPGPNNPGPNNPGPNNPGPSNPGPNNPGPNNPGPNNPGPNNPGPTPNPPEGPNPGPGNPGPDNPGPTPTPPEGPNPGPHPNPPEGPNPGPNPDPDPEPEPEPTVVTGTLSECDDDVVTTWCLVNPDIDDGAPVVLDLGDEVNLQTSQGDYDQDGTVETVQAELEGLLEPLAGEAREVTVGSDADGVIVELQGLPFLVAATDETPTDDAPTEDSPTDQPFR